MSMELLAALNELLEAERAGAKVALASARGSTPAYHDLMLQVRDDEAHWCDMLSRQIRRLGGAPSAATGAFREKALAIADPLERLAFLNRGQGWVVRRLEALLPDVADGELRQDLAAMLDAHRVNIDRAAELLAAESP